MTIETLLPKKLDKTDDSYKSVLDLNEALSSAEQEHIRNIALTGPFGSGKSSVLITLMEDFAEGRNYLPISLATLQANEEEIDLHESEEESNTQTPKKSEKDDVDSDNKDVSRKEKQIENLNRKIEYSILQQLIYREETKTVPNSRFRRITHLSKWGLFKYPFCIVLSIVCFFIVFEPSFAKVDTLYNLFNWGYPWNLAFDLIATAWLLLMLFVAVRYVLKSYSNSKLNKLNLKDGEIEVVENNSIFNRHLDEILYFFQVTQYNIVIIEDLDRFGTPNIFLKLRELNQLINESKIVNRHITFIYAVKDDIFKDEERTKFFDYITTVIPIINPSNSKDKLKHALEEKGCGSDGITDDDLSEMAFFIQDMRILTNIVNEYKQYRDKLCTSKGTKLNKTKLLAMIVYKNYYPQDFALLHRRQGKVYECISKKRLFVEEALKIIDGRKEKLSENEKTYINTLHLNLKELRLLFLYEFRNNANKRLVTIKINNAYRSLEDIADNDGFFEELLSLKTINYEYYYNYYNVTTSSQSVDLPTLMNELHYTERIEMLKYGAENFKKEYENIKKEIISIKSLKLKVLLNKYNLGMNQIYQQIHLSDMQDVFIRRGYIDEEYYDYISYFYPGMVSLEDRELLLNIKRQINQPYDYHIDKIENFVKELKEYMFESDAILNINLLDCLASKSIHKEMFNHFMYRLERNDAPLQFLSQYYIEGKQQNKVFAHYIEFDNSWNSIINWNNNTEKNNLIEAYLKYSSKITTDIQKWINANYKFLVEHLEEITLEKTQTLVANSCFTDLCDGSDDLLNYIVKHRCFKVNLNNLVIVTKHLSKGLAIPSFNNLNYTRIKGTNNDSFIGYVEDNISTVILELKDENKDESPESLLYILNSPSITEDSKNKYLSGQNYHIDGFVEILDENMYDVAIETRIILPTWENVSYYYTYKKCLSDTLSGYINHYANELSLMKCSDSIENKNLLYASLLGGTELAISNYSLLTTSFDGLFPQIALLEHLEKERLIILIKAGKVPFNQETITIINKTLSFADYIIYYSHEFAKKLDYNYKFSRSNAIEILKYGNFSLDDKYNIIGILPYDILKGSQILANIAIEVFNHKHEVNVNDEVLVNLIGVSNNIALKVQLITRLIRKGYTNHDNITHLVSAIDENYIDVCDKGKKVKLPNNELNLQFLTALEDIGFISSKREEKDGEYLRVYHKSQKNN